jgi:hypothetical protein
LSGAGVIAAWRACDTRRGLTIAERAARLSTPPTQRRARGLNLLASNALLGTSPPALYRGSVATG